MRIELLDHGYLQLVETWGSDERIIEAARMSTGKGFQGWGGDHEFVNELNGEDYCRRIVRDNWNSVLDDPTCCGRRREQHHVGPGDEKLLAYLWNNKHATPFEMAGMVIEVQAPIVVFREWHRHRTQSYNELSARYTPLPDVNYLPTPERCMIVSGTNKQAGVIKGADELTHESALEWLEELHGAYEHCEAVYQSGLRRGVPKEVARLPVNVGRYSRMRASANLRNWLAFLTLRMAPAAQWEIRQYANAMGGLIAEAFPRTWELFAKQRERAA